jgi:hypothetical protein
MANSANLKPVRSKKEARERGRNGGIASGVARREKRLLSEILRSYLDMPAVYIDPDLPADMTAGAMLVRSLIKKCIETGDARVFATIRDTIGEKPVEKVQQSGSLADNFLDLMLEAEKRWKNPDQIGELLPLIDPRESNSSDGQTALSQRIS